MHNIGKSSRHLCVSIFVVTLNCLTKFSSTCFISFNSSHGGWWFIRWWFWWWGNTLGASTCQCGCGKWARSSFHQPINTHVCSTRTSFRGTIFRTDTEYVATRHSRENFSGSCLQKIWFSLESWVIRIIWKTEGVLEKSCYGNFARITGKHLPRIPFLDASSLQLYLKKIPLQLFFLWILRNFSKHC